MTNVAILAQLHDMRHVGKLVKLGKLSKTATQHIHIDPNADLAIETACFSLGERGYWPEVCQMFSMWFGLVLVVAMMPGFSDLPGRSQSGGVNRATFERIKIGMTRQEIEKVVGSEGVHYFAQIPLALRRCTVFGKTTKDSSLSTMTFFCWEKGHSCLFSGQLDSASQT